jgi:protein deglycase
MPTVLVPLAQGCEEIEAVTIIDILRRAGITVVSAGLDTQAVSASRGTVLIPDTTLDEALKQSFDMVVLPGGQPGTNNLKADTRILALLRQMAQQDKYICAICAAPSVLATAGLLDGRSATCFPGALSTFGKVNLQNTAIVEDQKIITSRGPGTAMDFSLTLVERLAGKAKRDEVETGLVR